jgi:polyhydroxyalkanoate synthesis regulator phasin
MAANERIKKYLEAGTVFGQVTRARAEEIVKELASAGDIQRGQTQEWVDNLVERSRRTSEQVLDLVRHEVSAQLDKIDSKAIENIASQVADILKRSAEAGRTATAGATTQATRRARSARKSATKSAKSATKTAKATATNTAKAARKAAESVSPSGRRKKAPAKKTAAKKAPAKKAAAKKAPAKKTAAKKAPAKKTAAKKAGSGGSGR